MSGVNKVIIVGRLGRDPESITTKTGTEMCKMSIATSEKMKDGTEKTEWHRVVCFGKTAELAQKWLSKGREVYLEGALSTSTYEKDGEKRYSTDIICRSLTFLGGSRQESAREPEPYEPGPQPPMDFGGDDVPF